MQSSSWQPARMKMWNFLGYRSLTGPGKCQQDRSSRDISNYKCRTKHHNLTDKSYSLSKRNGQLRNSYIFNISDLDWTTQWSTWIHFLHQVLPPAALANFFPQTSLPCSLISLSPRDWSMLLCSSRALNSLLAPHRLPYQQGSCLSWSTANLAIPHYPSLPQAHIKSRTMY